MDTRVRDPFLRTNRAVLNDGARRLLESETLEEDALQALAKKLSPHRSVAVPLAEPA